MIVYLDTNVVIYAIELHAVFGIPAQSRLASSLAVGDSLMISDLVRMECLVGPIKAGNAVLEKKFRTFFASKGMRVVPISPAVCDRAASIRASNNFKSMDALQLAAAVEHGADVFLTADGRLKSFTDITVEILK